MMPIRYRKRIAFRKEGKIRFIGHLDMLRTFQRALSRAGVELVFSQGFNPIPRCPSRSLCRLESAENANTWSCSWQNLGKTRRFCSA